MSIGDYKNKLAKDLEYWRNVNEAKLPDQDIIDMVPSLTDEERELLPNEVVGFYKGGQWFWNFIGWVALPYIRVTQLFNMRHISDLFKTYLVSDDHNISVPMADEAFDLLKYLPTDAAREICLELCEDRGNAEILMNSVIRDDLSTFTTCFTGLSLPDLKLKALTKTINTLKQTEFFNSVQEIEEISNMSMLSNSLKGLISDVSFEKENGIEASNVLMDVIDTFNELVEEKHNEDLNKYICENYHYRAWITIAKRLFCPAVYAMRRIWDSLTTEEKDVANEILNPEREMIIVIDGERTRPTQHIINLALRWSKISRKKVLERDKDHDANETVNEITPEPLKVSNRIVKANGVRLPFPTRLVNNSDKIYSQSYNKILGAIYEKYGLMFENMGKEDFIYLFGATNRMPQTYNPPYYWTADESLMKAMLRILYSMQPRVLKNLILHISDREAGKSSHDWGRNKNKVAYYDTERTIIGIVREVSGATLQEL